jgi:hypothetical protein
MNNKSKNILDSHPKKIRKDYEPLPVIAKQGWRFHHLGIPTNTPRADEKYIKHLKMYVSGFESSPYGIEWMRFDSDCPILDIIKTVPHIAFEVDDLESALEGKKILSGISSPSKGVRVAMIIDNEAPIELLEFTQK